MKFVRSFKDDSGVALNISACYYSTKQEMATFFKFAKSKEKHVNSNGRTYYKYDWENSATIKFDINEIVKISDFFLPKMSDGSEADFVHKTKSITTSFKIKYENSQLKMFISQSKYGNEKVTYSIALNQVEIVMLKKFLNIVFSDYVRHSIIEK